MEKVRALSSRRQSCQNTSTLKCFTSAVKARQTERHFATSISPAEERIQEIWKVFVIRRTMQMYHTPSSAPSTEAGQPANNFQPPGDLGIATNVRLSVEATPSTEEQSVVVCFPSGKAYVLNDNTATINYENGKVLEENECAFHSHSSPSPNNELTLENEDLSCGLLNRREIEKNTVISESEFEGDFPKDKVVINEYHMRRAAIPVENTWFNSPMAFELSREEYLSPRESTFKFYESDSTSVLKNTQADPQLCNNSCLEEPLSATPTTPTTPSSSPLLTLQQILQPQSLMSQLLQHHLPTENDMTKNGFHHKKGKSHQSLKKINVPGDGDCLFHSIGLYLRQILAGNDRVLVNHLHDLGIDSTTDVVLRLRELMVNEWKNNINCYEEYLVEEKRKEFQEKMYEFLQPGIYAGDFGDLMLTAIVNVLQIPATVEMSDGTETQKVLPKWGSLSSSAVIHLQLDCSGSGHYDALVQSTTTKYQNSSKPAASSSCSCGKNEKSTEKSLTRKCCSNEGMKYKTRCPCFKNKQGCSPSCRCKGCSNPYGKKEKRKASHSTNLENHEKKKKRRWKGGEI